MITYHAEVVQGSDEWASMRCGLLTASEMHLIVTPTLKIADNDKTRAHLFELLAQRITQHVEPQYVSDAMLRGMDDEITAVEMYGKHHAPTHTTGFVTNDKWGFTIGYSPDALVEDDGLVECKSRMAKYQVQTIIQGGIPAEYMIQLQTGLLVTERKWIDFVSYCGGLPMYVARCLPDEKIQEAIITSATAFEQKMVLNLQSYSMLAKALIPTERKIVQEMFV
jgi:predicted phage-related endonuclease